METEMREVESGKYFYFQGLETPKMEFDINSIVLDLAS